MIAKVIAILLVLEQPAKGQLYGDEGRAIGPLQIHRAVVIDVNRIYGTQYTWESCASLTVSKEVCKKYLTYWCSAKKLGHKPTIRDYLRTWNAGAMGHKKIKATKFYIAKAKQKGLIKWTK